MARTYNAVTAEVQRLTAGVSVDADAVESLLAYLVDRSREDVDVQGERPGVRVAGQELDRLRVRALSVDVIRLAANREKVCGDRHVEVRRELENALADLIVGPQAG